MAVDQWGAKNQPVFLATGAPEVDVDPTAAAEYAAKVGNRRVGTTAERTAATGADVWEGLEWHDTTDDFVYQRRSGGWVRDMHIFAFMAGTVDFTTDIASGAVSAAIPVSFGSTRFSVGPIVTAICSESRLTIGIESVSWTGCSFRLRNNSGATANQPFTIYWHAVQMLSGTAAG